MIRVLIVDDEPLIRIGIRVSLSECGGKVKVVGEEYNGARALEFLRKQKGEVDCILTDIKMPVMDGIELIRHVKAEFPEIKVIVLSSYNDIDYVRDALKNGAGDYLLKHEIDDKNLAGKLEQVFGNEKQERSEEGTEADMEPGEQLLRNIMKGKEAVSGTPVRLPALAFVMRVKKANSNLLEEGRTLFRSAVMNILEEGLGTPCRGKIAVMDDMTYAGLLPLDGNERYENSFEFCQMLLKKYLDIITWCGVSDVFRRKEEIPEAYTQACAAVEVEFFPRRGACDYSEYRFLKKADCGPIFREYTKKIIESVKTGGNTAAETAFDELLRALSRCRGAKKEAIKSGFWALAEQAVSGTGVMPDIRLLHEHDGSLCELCHTVKNIVLSSGDFYGVPYTEYSIKKKAMRYINEHFDDADLNLTKLAEYMNLSTSYLSRSFKNNVGVGFVEYLTRLRMEKAVEYIKGRSDLSMQEISMLVGFENYNHFSKTFKRVMGCSPSGFR